MPNLKWSLLAAFTRFERKNFALWNRFHARTAKARRTPTGFTHYPVPRFIGSFDIGQQLKEGQFFFAGELVQASMASIWSFDSPSPEFTSEMQGFGWLDDLAAVGDMQSRLLAQDWVRDWIRHFGNGKGEAWTPALTGQRLLRICANAEFLFQDLDHTQANHIYHSLARQLDYLSRSWRKQKGTQHRLEALAGMAFAGVSFEGRKRLLNSANKAIGAECQRNIGPEGEISTRNPEELMEIFTLLTWVARTFEDADETPDPRLTSAMERIAPSLRNLRLGNGTLARFHGGGRGREGRLDQVLSDSRIRGARPGKLSMGYDRLTSARITLMVDCAVPPELASSQHAHASTLAFEMSSGRVPLIVNCGAGRKFGVEWEHVCRETGAHNTVVLDGASSSDIANEGYISDTFGERLSRPPTTVTRARNGDLQGNWLLASHDGYAKDYGLIHHRRLHLSTDGREFRGQDNLSVPNATNGKALTPENGTSFDAHFHLHPDVTAKLADDAQSVTLQLPNNEIWVFHQDGGKLTLDDSVYLDQWRLKPRATKQIVVTGRIVEYAGQITWIFKRVKDGERFAAAERSITP